MRLTPEQLHILQHTLGLDQYGRGDRYRNNFYTDPESRDGKNCEALVEMGLMQQGRAPYSTGERYYHVTPAGIDAVALQSPEPPKVSRAARRYRAYLESDSDQSFIDWLRWQQELKKHEPDSRYLCRSY